MRLFALALVFAVPCTGAEAVRSPSGRLLSNFTECTADKQACIPEVVISKADGAEIRRFAVRAGDGPCASILNTQWAGETAVGVECHGNPSLSFYYEVDIASGKILQNYMGYNFVRSPNLALVAHVGWIMHFAPPWLQSHHLQVGSTILYPLPSGVRPVKQRGLEMPPNVVHERGLLFEGVHEFATTFAWSPDSRRIGFVDCLVDYRLRDSSPAAFDEHGNPENRRCFAVAVAMDGTFVRRPIVENVDRSFTMRWTDARTFTATSAKGSLTVHVP